MQRGKDALRFISTLASLAARAVKCGRRLVKMESSADVLSDRAQRKHGFLVESLPAAARTVHEELYSSPDGQRLHDAFEERLRDNTVTPVPEQVAFRIDFPAWLGTLTGRERRLVRAMARNERTTDLSKEFEVSPGRISQMRREFCDDWLRFHGELAPAGKKAAAR